MSRQEFKLPLDIARVDRSNLLPALESVRGCLKTTSMLWMHALGLPVLQGIVVSDWSDDSALTVKRFCRRGHLTMLLLRIDKPHERWTRRRGGYLVPLKDVGESVTELKRHGMIAALLEPASPYADQYSLAGVTAPVDGKMTVEIVGPGFDASDILRGDLPAQERWEVSFTAMRSNRSVRESISCRRVHVLTPTQYLQSVRLRLAKIGARVKNPSFPDADVKGRIGESTELVAEGEAFLKKTRQLTLLRHAKIYSPIPEKHVALFSRLVAKLLSGLSSYGINLGPSSFAASVIPKRGLIFWDFFPARKQEADYLYPSNRQVAPFTSEVNPFGS